MEIKLLIIEDDPEQIELYKDTIERFNEEQTTYKITHDINDNQIDGFTHLQNLDNVYDAAILDLQIGEDKTVGYQFIENIRANLRFPIFVRSGNLEVLPAELRAESNTFLRFYLRDQKTVEDLLKEIVSIAKTGITKLLNRKGIIEQFIHKIFWNHLVTSMPYWVEEKSDTQGALLRYTLSHIQEYLAFNESGIFDIYHPIEVYIKPVIKSSDKTVFTGDLMKSEDEYYIVLTPACDLVVDDKRPIPKAKYILLAKIESIEDQIKDLNAAKKRTKSDSIKRNQEYNYHYLPDSLLFKGGCINFQCLKSVPLNEILDTAKYKVELSLNTVFLKDIIARFAHYYSRQGQPSIK